MSKLRELEKRLREEPENLGLRVMVAGALHEAGRRDDATELYRSVAIAYRDQGRMQQAISVCRSVLELVPGDASCQELLAALLAGQGAPREAPDRERIAPSPATARPSPSPEVSRASPPASRAGPLPASRPSPPPAGRPSPPRLPRPPSPEPLAEPEPVRRSSGDVTPLPQPLPYHEADPSTASAPTITRAELLLGGRDSVTTFTTFPEIAGIANAARRISASLLAANQHAAEVAEHAQPGAAEAHDADDAAAELDTRRRPRINPDELDLFDDPPPVVTPRGSPAMASSRGADRPSEPGDDDPTFPPPRDPGRDGGPADEEHATPPRELSAKTALGDDEPSSAGIPRADAGDGAEDDKTLPRDLPGRARPPSPGAAAAASAPASEAAIDPLATALFAALPAHNRVGVLQRFRRLQVAGGTAVFRRGETGHGLVLVVRGRLELRAERSDGTVVPLGVIGPGEHAGEAGLLGRAPAAAHLVAVTGAELLVLGASDFYEVVAAFPALWAELKAIAARRAHEHEQRLR
ncbi:MAG TPA: cyclic nucleotide-binding domain-containing protein [Kofleriaceae bacterium]|nr:cyclic nucleotide-binding domain-containing protein [Kofleriaceae bacterium]